MENSNWKEYKFSELLIDNSISYGVVQPGFHTENGIPIIRVNNIKNGNINISDILRIDSNIEKKYLRTRLKGGELLITIVGSVGDCAIVPKSLAGYNVARAVSVANINSLSTPEYIKYAFKTEDLKFQMYGNTNDTVQPTLNLAQLKELVIKLPPLPEQKAIASVLSSLDDKIDLLHQQNQTLEALAETLYLNFIDEREFNSKLSDIFSLQNGYAFKSKSFKESGTIRVIKIKNISGDIVDITNSDFVDDESIKKLDFKFKINSGDILIAMTGAEVGKLGIVPETDQSLWLNQRVGLLKEKFEGAKYLAYLHLKSDFGQDYIENTATGSAQPNISGEGIENCEFPLYEETELREICNKLSPLYDKVIFNLGQIHTLTQMRDTLLPKLMSGEVRVQL